MLNVSGEEAFLRRAQLGDSKTKEASTSGATATAAVRDKTGYAGTWGTMSAAAPRDEYVPPSRPAAYEALVKARAQRMMMKMGWKEGQGLGKRTRE